MENCQVGSGLGKGRGLWNFGGDVPNVFVEHVRQSVPLYEEGHVLVCGLSDFFVRTGSLAYELGVSTGELIRKLARHNRDKEGVRWLGLDVEPGMIAKAREHCVHEAGIELVCDDLVTYRFEPCDMVVSYYTLQFVPPELRRAVIGRVYDALRPGGALVLFEKVRGPNARIQDFMVALYNDFKLGKGFTVEEVFNKSRSLRGVLEPFSSDENAAMLRQAGFGAVTTIAKYICFEGLLAIK